jgi:hypothetical protein
MGSFGRLSHWQLLVAANPSISAWRMIPHHCEHVDTLDFRRQRGSDKYAWEKAEEIAKLMTSGTWTRDYPITCERARSLGLPVNTDMPKNALRLMELYPQPMRRQPSVEYVPLPYRTKRPAASAP